MIPDYDYEIVRKYFDNLYFMKAHPDHSYKSFDENLRDYLHEGWQKGASPVEWFDSVYYLARSPDVSALNIEPFSHFIRTGALEGRSPCPPEKMSEEGQLVIASLQLFPESDLVAAAELFDPALYVREHPEVEQNHCDPLRHYLHVGRHRGWKPNEWFNAEAYAALYSDVKPNELPAFLHFVRWGLHQGRNPNPSRFSVEEAAWIERSPEERAVWAHLDPDWYNQQVGESVAGKFDPTRHYMALGWRQGHSPNKWFDPEYYLLHNRDVREADTEPFHHFIKHGYREGRRANAENQIEADLIGVDPNLLDFLAPHFDADHYALQVSLPKDSHLDPLRHYILYGEKAGFSPNNKFDPDEYIRLYLPQGRPQQTCLFHFLKFGKDLNRPLSRPQLRNMKAPLEQIRRIIQEEFDTDYYRRTYAPNSDQDFDAIGEFIERGASLDHNPAPWFDTAGYRRAYLAGEASSVNPFFHYLIYGRSVGNSPQPGDDVRLEPNATVVPIAAAYASFFDFGCIEQCPSPGDINLEQLDIHFVIPDFKTSKGGHMTISRIVRWLEFFGHKCTIWIENPGHHSTPENARSSLLLNFQTLKAEVKFRNKDFFLAQGDAVFATSWQTAYTVKKSGGFREKFYLVQDYEPEFYPTGSESILAECTYNWGLNCICASAWLRARLEERGNWARHFWLACDSQIYHDRFTRTRNETLQLAVYARPQTPRRAVELALLSLETLARQGEAFHVHLFGEHLDLESSPFPVTRHGVLDEAELAELYRNCDIGLVFSATNYSLAPKEMMACGLAVIEIDRESTRATYPDGVVQMVGPEPAAMVDGVREMLRDEGKRTAIAHAGKEWAAQFSWEMSVRMIEQALVEKLGGEKTSHEDPTAPNASTTASRQPGKRSHATPKVSVIIPTFNGGDLLLEVCEALTRQQTPWPYEVLIFDSTSNDGSFELCQAKFPDFTYHRIPQSDFSHGRTRNRAIAATRSPFVAFLTQDAKPINEHWLYNLVAVLEAHPDAAGAFGRHCAWDTASPYDKRDLRDFFRSFDKDRVVYSKYQDPVAWNIQQQSHLQRLHFFSNNNSCLRRAVWEKIPLPEVEYGEDQAWAHEIIKAGHEKLYARFAQVYHSHDYTIEQRFERSRTEAQFFRRQFGYLMVRNEKQLRSMLTPLNEADELWGRNENVPEGQIQHRLALNDAHLRGWLAGTTER